jgi:hypothetical protein
VEKNSMMLQFMNKAAYNVFKLSKNFAKLDVTINGQIPVAATFQNHMMLTH